MLDDFQGVEDAEEEKRKTAEKRKLQAAQEKSDLIWLMKQKPGRRLMYRDLAEAGVFTISFNTNAMQMSFNEGNRNQGLRKLNMIMKYCPDQYGAMMTENTDD